jgi:hypothetical protein
MKTCLFFKDRYKKLVSHSVTRPSAPVANFLFGPGEKEEKSTQIIETPGSAWVKILPESSKLSASERKEMVYCESLLPLQALIAYRQQVTLTLTPPLAQLNPNLNPNFNLNPIPYHTFHPNLNPNLTLTLTLTLPRTLTSGCD